MNHIPFSVRQRGPFLCGIVAAIVQIGLGMFWSSIPVQAQTATPPELIDKMAGNERAALKENQRLMYLSEEKSTRTGGHLWTERVVETKDGLFKRLLAVDGKPLAPRQAEAENQRLAYLVAHPAAFRRLNQNRTEDLGRTRDLLNMLPHAFLFTDQGVENGCERIGFQPNPKFQPGNFEQRVLHAMGGTVLVSAEEKRLCGLDAQVEQEVDFAFGLLGKVNRGGRFSLTREEVVPGSWRTIRLSVHVDGRLLLMKSISRNEEFVHSDFKPIPDGLSPAAANELSLQGP